MSVLIKGIEMPKSCYDCNCFIRDSDGSDYCCLLMQDIEDNNKRDDDCPIVPVPPHGRLIEAEWLKDAMITTLEALKKNPKMDRQEMHLIAAFDTLRVMVEDAPTIIEAEEGE